MSITENFAKLTFKLIIKKAIYVSLINISLQNLFEIQVFFKYPIFRNTKGVPKYLILDRTEIFCRVIWKKVCKVPFPFSLEIN